MYSLSMEHMWTSAHRFEWTPIITFGARRPRLLEWFERNTRPVSFTDTDDRVGIAIDHPGLRAVVTRRDLTLTTNASGLDIERLKKAIEGIFEVLEPQRVRHARSASVWTSALEGSDYDEERALMAGRLVGSHGRTNGILVTDASALVDLEMPDYTGQAEWGIVTDSELMERLADPKLARLSSLRPAHSQHFSEQAPPVSLLTDVVLDRVDGASIESHHTVVPTATMANDSAREVARLIAQGHIQGRGINERSQTG